MAIQRLSIGRGQQPRTLTLPPDQYSVYDYGEMMPYGEPVEPQPQPQPLPPAQQASQQMLAGPQFRSSGSPSDLAENDRMMSQWRGDVLGQQARDTEGIYGGLENFYSDQAMSAYQPLIAGQGGYGPEGEANIVREGELQGLLQQQDPNQLYMTGDEEREYMGNPYSSMGYFDPGASERQQHESSAYQRDAYRNLGTGLQSAATQPGLGIGEYYAPAMAQTLGDTEAAVRGAIDPARLGQSEDFVNAYRMTPQQQQDIITGAGISAGMGYRTAAGDLQRSAAAAGMNPMGVAAARARLERGAAADAGDAMTQARIQANREAAGREFDIERNRQGAEQYIAGQRAVNEQQLGARRAGLLQSGEQMRLGAAQDMSNRAMEAARIGGQAALSGEQAINQQQRQVGQFNTQTGMQGLQQAEAEAARRQQALLNYRKQTQRYNQEQQFGRGMDVNQALSQRYGNVYGARRGEAQEGRGFLTGQATRYGGYGENARNRQVDIYGTQGQLAQGGTRNRLQADQAPRWWERAIGAGAGALGAATGAGLFGGARRR